MNYLAKFGWDSSKGLGASGEGMKSHLKASQKLDMLGIGAAHQLDPNGIAWKQNKDFERLLERLNGDAVEGTVVDGFKMADDGGEADGVGKETLDLKDDGKQKKRKRKHDIEEPKKRKKKNGKEDGDGTKDDPRDDESINLSSEKEPAIPTPRKTVPSVPRHRAYAAFPFVYFHFP
jgi:Pin2-interacting protein X1